MSPSLEVPLMCLHKAGREAKRLQCLIATHQSLAGFKARQRKAVSLPQRGAEVSTAVSLQISSLGGLHFWGKAAESSITQHPTRGVPAWHHLALTSPPLAWVGAAGEQPNRQFLPIFFHFKGAQEKGQGGGRMHGNPK